MDTKFISYSSLLIDFIEPLLTGDEDELEFLDKAKLGQIAWNFSVSDKNELLHDDIYKSIFLIITGTDANLKEILNQLVLRKGMNFSQYNQFIFTVENRKTKSGSWNLYVESAPADQLKNL